VNAVETEALEKRFGRVRALAGVSTAIPAGSLNLLSGPNGAGKSTLLRVLAGLTRPTRGSVLVLERDPFGRGKQARSRVSYLGPEVALYGDLTVAENLAFCARLHDIPARRVQKQLVGSNLAEVADRRVRALSTGYRRRTGLARALLTQPDLLLLDEPWNGLDSEAADQLLRALNQLRDRGGTALVAAHALGAYASIFDHTLQIEDGRLEPPGAA